MELIYTGKTKDVYKLENGNVLLKFKDDVTGTDGVFDPGANQVGLSIEGVGNSGLRLTTYFFELLAKNGVKTHYVKSDFDNNTMEVLAATVFGKGIEVVCRYKAVGSFLRRYGLYVKEEQVLDALVEITLKDDGRDDPLITKDSLEEIGILNGDEYEALKSQTKKICGILKEDLAQYGLDLYDIKLEFGRNSGGVILIDEISGGSMRAYKNGKSVEPLALAEIVLGQ